MNRISSRVYGLTCVVMLLASFAARATTIVLPTDEQLVAKAPLILTGTVLSATPVDRDGTIWTETTVVVDSTLKGTSGKTITVREIGGLLGDRITKIYGAPELTEGERVLLFLEPVHDHYRVIDLFVGKFGEAKTGDGRRLWMRNDAHDEATLLDADLRPIEAQNIQRDAKGFETFIADRIAGRAGTKTYGIENPVLADALRDTKNDIESNFTLISEPQVYRWYRFGDGQSAAWYMSGSQPGYANGGISEMQTGIASWVGYSAAKILYTYAGALPVAPKGLTGPNGYNEVLFNDPLNEISGSWSPTSGGVVGVGGFNGVSNGGTFTATFQADPDHPAGSIRAFAITEGNLTIQNNVSPVNGISNTELAEIIAHEFGHTLGFGHSADSSALMYYSVTGLGPSLRDDDRVAARWLYPNGAPTGPVPGAPNAPSGLSAVVTGTNVDLAWTDNATDETSQSIYLSLGSASFNKVADVAANARSARLSGLGPGSYRVYVVANNSAGSSAQSNTATFAIAGPPVASFSFTPLTGNAGVTTFTFTDTSTGAVTSRQWSFGDGSTPASSPSATHVYSSPGLYTVTLTVSGPGGSSTTTKKVTVLVPLAANFSWSPANPTTSHTIQFLDQTAGGPATWSWSFGDGTSSTEQNPSKKYGAQGTYNVTLTVSGNGGSSTKTLSLRVTNTVPGSPAVSAAFDISTSEPAIGSNVTFIDRSTGSPTQWVWTFGDGATSSARNPVHAYAAPGTYTITLNASNASTSSIVSKQITVSAIAAYRTLVSAAAQTSGAGGTSWRTELSLFNAGLEGVSVTMSFLPTGGNVLTRTLYLPPRQSITYANTLLEVFGLPNGAGAVSIEGVSPGSSAQLRVTSRTFTTGKVGTYGQSVPEIQPHKLEPELYITGIASNDAYRTNIGLVNRAASPVSVALTLYTRGGGTIATKDITLAANSFQQSALWAYFPEVSGASHDVLTIRITAPVADAVSAYASVIDNVTQDPIFIQAGAAPAGDALTIPIVGRIPGANGTFWRSDVTLFNPTSDRFTVTLRFNGDTRALSLGGRDTEVLADILSSFGQTAGAGLLSVEWDGGTGPVVTSRTYTTAVTGGTYGQSIDPIANLRTEMFVPGLRNDADFRTNIGILNAGDEPEAFTVIVLSPFGNELGRNSVVVPARGQVQSGVSSLFPNVNSSAFTLSVQGAPGARLFTYASMVDNASGDPVFFAGQ